MEKTGNKYPVKKYPIIGACGLYCGLCPNYHSTGPSRCPGCCGPDFFQKHPTCRFITCAVKQKGMETCAQCAEWATCPKVGRLFEFASRGDSIISYKPVADNFAYIQKYGIEELASLVQKKQEVLTHLLTNYNDGRSKSFYCTSCQLLPLDRLKETVSEAEKQVDKNTTIKGKTIIMRSAIGKLADELKIELKLRK